jgi:hypothetical protein
LVKCILELIRCVNAQMKVFTCYHNNKNFMWIIQGVCELREVHQNPISSRSATDEFRW